MEYRYQHGHVQWGYDAYIAVSDCSLVGHTGTMVYEDSGLELSVQVFDCSGHDVEPGLSVLEAGGYVAELDAASWEHYGGGRVRLTID
jgi:hypothetical protein